MFQTPKTHVITNEVDFQSIVVATVNMGPREGSLFGMVSLYTSTASEVQVWKLRLHAFYSLDREMMQRDEKSCKVLGPVQFRRRCRAVLFWYSASGSIR